MTCKFTGNLTQIRVIEPDINHFCNGTAVPTIGADISAFTAQTIACVYNFTPPGITYDTTTDDECIGDASTPATDLGTQQADVVSLEIAFCPGANPGFGVGESIYQWLFDRAQAADPLIFMIAYPPNPAVAAAPDKELHHFFCGKVQTIKPASVEKRTFMRLPVEILRSSDILVRQEA